MKLTKNKKFWVRTVLSVISSLCLLIAAYMTIQGQWGFEKRKSEATATVEAKLTEEYKRSSVRTQSAIPPSATWTISPSVNETPTPTVTSIANVILQDEFIDNRNDWFLQNDQDTTTNITGGKYKQTTNCPQTTEGSYCLAYIPVPGFSSRDLQFEIDVEIKSLSPGADVMIPFRFRINDGNYYLINFRSTGKYTAGAFLDGKTHLLLEQTTIPGYNTTTETTYRYGFKVIDTLITPLFNGQELLSIEDGNINTTGSALIAIFVSKGGSAHIELDNLLATGISKPE
ncbi:MAG: hypothetical protein HPY76_09405 [Anaerolineae bacterium]|nr:hypothetical protein [Anaerolineae bacterium]